MSESCGGCHADATHFLCDECLGEDGRAALETELENERASRRMYERCHDDVLAALKKAKADAYHPEDGEPVVLWGVEALVRERDALRAQLESRDEGFVEVAAAMRATAERQREACAEAMLRSVDGCGCLPCREQAVRTTPLVTETKP